jgi:hypothetical protein
MSTRGTEEHPARGSNNLSTGTATRIHSGGRKYNTSPRKSRGVQYLGRLLAQDDDNIQAIRNQIRKARGTWARIGQVLTGENTPPRVSGKFYKAIIQSVLLYESETWNITGTALKQLEGFHIRGEN